MAESIGQAAGKIWNYLEENGAASVSKITNETGLNKNDVHRALGWLAREEKIAFELNGRTETISLI
ncbi:MAG: winged helix-turn-helix domain-containing protein [Gammaproteobacteria bacterium]